MRSRLASLALTLGVVAIGGALTALGAYLTNHSADQPALYAVLVLLVREASKYVDALDWTRRLRGGAPTGAGVSWTLPAKPGAAPGLGAAASEPTVTTPAPPATSPEAPAS